METLWRMDEEILVGISYIHIHIVCYTLDLAQMGKNQRENQRFET